METGIFVRTLTIQTAFHHHDETHYFARFSTPTRVSISKSSLHFTNILSTVVVSAAAQPRKLGAPGEARRFGNRSAKAAHTKHVATACC